MTLNAKQQAFVAEYLIDLNATHAAKRAGYSKKTAHVIGHENLNKPEIAAAIADAQAERAKRTEISQDMVLKELARIGFSDIRRVLTQGGGVRDPNDWDDDTAATISSFECVTTYKGEEDEDGNKIPEYVKKFRTWDKLNALEKLGKHLGMFKDGAGVNINVNPKEPASDDDLASAIVNIMIGTGAKVDDD